MITHDEYFGPRKGHPEVTDTMRISAYALLARVNNLLDWAWAQHRGYYHQRDPDTGTCVSGTRGGKGDGGWRPSDATTGAPKSMHKRAHAVDVYDPNDVLDNMLNDAVLERFGLYRETPRATPGWCHLQDLPPGSGRRTYDV